jgi:hypothetical protein
MEVVAPRRSLAGPDYLRLFALAVVSVAVHGWVIAHTSVTARDSIGFARYALGIQNPESAGPFDPKRTALDVIRGEKQPPGYPMAVRIVGAPVRHWLAPHASKPEQMLLATQVTSAIAALLLVVPMYLLGRMLFGRNVAFAAALLFQVLPVPARITSDGLAEATYLLGVVTALAIGVRAVRRPRIGWFLACGIVIGLTYLVRPEGLMVAGAVGGVIAWLGLTRKWPRDVALGRLTALAVGVALTAGPYMVAIGKVTNKPTGGGMMESLPGVGRLIGKPQSQAPAGGPVFAAFWTLPSDAGAAELVLPAVLQALKETAQGLHYLGAAVAAFGLLALRRRIAADPGVALLVVTMAGASAVVLWLGVHGKELNGVWTYYVSERHVILLVLLGCVFAVAGLSELRQRVKSYPPAVRTLPIVVLLVLVGISIPSALKPLHANREGHKHAGLWLKENLKHDDCLVDPFEWAGCYSEKTLHHVFPDPNDPEVIYAVTDDKDREEDHARLPRMREARAVMADGRSVVAYHWPEDRPVPEAKVTVYKLVRPKLE